MVDSLILGECTPKGRLGRICLRFTLRLLLFVCLVYYISRWFMVAHLRPSDHAPTNFVKLCVAPTGPSDLDAFPSSMQMTHPHSAKLARPVFLFAAYCQLFLLITVSKVFRSAFLVRIQHAQALSALSIIILSHVLARARDLTINTFLLSWISQAAFTDSNRNPSLSI